MPRHERSTPPNCACDRLPHGPTGVEHPSDLRLIEALLTAPDQHTVETVSGPVIDGIAS
jgi:hypothetical protein